jgi:hypothetical protein
MARNPIIREPNPKVPADPEHRECFACYSGVIYIGYLVEDDASDEVEVFSRGAPALFS